MPFRDYGREQIWLLPPSLGDLLPNDHPARFVAAFVDELDVGDLGIQAVASDLGAPSYHPRLLLNCWLYGFMEGKRSTRALECACRETVPYMWLTGLQKPDHVTLWRFYKQNRKAMRKLFKCTVKLAVRVGLVDFALQAIDGTKIKVGSSSKMRTRKALQKLLKRVEEEIASLEQENEALVAQGSGSSKKALAKKEGLRKRVRQAMAQLEEEEGEQSQGSSQESKGNKVASVTDPEARLMKGRQGWALSYNAQALVDGKHQIVVAAEVSNEPVDTHQLIPLLEQSQEMTGQYGDTILADRGYYSGENLEAAEKCTDLLMPDPRLKGKKSPQKWSYHKDHFRYDAERDEYICPQGKRLTSSHRTKSNNKRYDTHVYRCRECAGCPVREECTRDRHGRTIHIGEYESIMRSHGEKMVCQETRDLYKRRAPLVEGLFGVIKERLQAHRFLLRGIDNTRAEWHLLCTASNMRKLHKYWWQSQQTGQLRAA